MDIENIEKEISNFVADEDCRNDLIAVIEYNESEIIGLKQCLQPELAMAWALAMWSSEYIHLKDYLWNDADMRERCCLGVLCDVTDEFPPAEPTHFHKQLTMLNAQDDNIDKLFHVLAEINDARFVSNYILQTAIICEAAIV